MLDLLFLRYLFAWWIAYYNSNHILRPAAFAAQKLLHIFLAAMAEPEAEVNMWLLASPKTQCAFCAKKCPVSPVQKWKSISQAKKQKTEETKEDAPPQLVSNLGETV